MNPAIVVEVPLIAVDAREVAVKRRNYVKPWLAWLDDSDYLYANRVPARMNVARRVKHKDAFACPAAPTTGFKYSCFE